MKYNHTWGIKLLIDRTTKEVFFNIEDDANIVEGTLGEHTLDYNDIPIGADFDAYFTGDIHLINLERVPVTVTKSEIKPIQQEELKFKSKNEEPTVSEKKFVYFSPVEYEKHKAAGTKYRPIPSLSKKQQKKFHSERRDYENRNSYSPMYISEKNKGDHIPDKVKGEDIPSEIIPATAQQSTKEESRKVEEEEHPNAEMKLAMENAKLIEESAVKINDNVTVVGTREEIEKELSEALEADEDLPLGSKNLRATFQDVFDGWMIAHHHKQDNMYTIAATKAHPKTQEKLYLTFEKEKTARFVFDQMKKHSKLDEQVKDGTVVPISDALCQTAEDALAVENIPVVIIVDGLSYLRTL